MVLAQEVVMITSKSTDIGTDTSRTSGTDGVDTLPDNAAGELADAVEWLRKAGVTRNLRQSGAICHRWRNSLLASRGHRSFYRNGD